MANFSVLMSVYYKEQPDYLRQSLDSIFHQTVRASQVVLVQDGPLLPELEEVIRDYSERYPELDVLPLSENRGLGIALAEGIKHCKNELVARMDTDDVARQDRFELQLKEFEKNPQLDICGSHITEFENEPTCIVTRRRVPLTDEECKKYQKRRDAFNHMTVMYKKSAVLAAGNYQHCPLMEDTLLWVNMFKNGATAMNIDDYLVNARIGKGMYERRGGWVYYKKYKRARNRIYETGYISWWDYVYTLMVQFVVALMPNSLRGGDLSSCCIDEIPFDIPEKTYEIAVIIPTLNEERFISRCLESVIAQTFPLEKMDIMVVDGGSRDNTRIIVEEYHRRYSNIRLINNPGRIQSIAFNIGVRNSTAPYIVRMDAHAFYKPFYIEGCIEGLKGDSNRGNVGGQWDIQPQNESLWAVTNAILNYSKFGIGGATYRVGANAGNVDTVPFGAFPRKVIDEIGGMRNDLPRGEDNEYNSRIKKAGYKIYFDPRIECVYYARSSFIASCKQMFANGESIGHLFYVDWDSIGFRHMVPLFFVIGILGGLMLSLIYHPFLCVLGAGLFLYFVCDLIASISASKKHGWKYCLPLFVLFFSVHISYGLGTIKGLVTRNRKSKEFLWS